MRVEVLVVGSGNVDLMVRVGRRPGGGETVTGAELVESAGGKGANQAAAAARLGAGVALLARVGADAFGELLVAAQQDAGTDVRQVVVDQQARTGTALIVVDAVGENSIVVSPGANARLSPEDVAAARAVFAEAAVVSVQLEIPPETVRAAVESAAAHGARVVLNPSPVPDSLAGLPPGVLEAADPLVVNEHEARQLAAGAAASTAVAPDAASTVGPPVAADPAGAAALTGGAAVGAAAVVGAAAGPVGAAAGVGAAAVSEAVVMHGAEAVTGGQPVDWARALRAAGARSVVVTLGAGGAFVLDGAAGADGTGVAVPGVPARVVVDSTGAGDAFTGALTLRLARGDALAAAAAFAVRAGAAAVGAAGAQRAYAEAGFTALAAPASAPSPGPAPGRVSGSAPAPASASATGAAPAPDPDPDDVINSAAPGGN